MKMEDLQFIRFLGKGAFGTVNLHRYKPNNELYAVKAMRKYDLIQQGQVDHIHEECRLMGQIKHPFIINMVGHAHDTRFVYIIMECVFGGELYSHMKRVGRFDEQSTKFFCAQIASAFRHMHHHNVIHRDLKPENILVALDGYVKLADFGFAKVLKPDARTYTTCGTPEYIAPEILLQRGHNAPADWWSFGILIYEMINGDSPFANSDPLTIYQNIIAGKVYFKKHFSKSCKSLVKKLLTADLSQRYGNLVEGDRDIIEHSWFRSINFKDLESKKIRPPFKPIDNGSLTPETNNQHLQNLPPEIIPSKDPFKDW